ncbi:hypothetical protein OEZ85_005245 [Tetradesmus obliquus]|uniref:Uncharacterized protein n=1 Tax=Tetradesmus obliquus TaxID=3088 RepID=A0ABY8UID2_TETOB|nr:hypothetical protein OEZ85_005245 [Tetradesmus obliquus]
MVQQRVVLVTGCTEGGLGHCLCKAFARYGCKVYATGRCKDAIKLKSYGCVELELDVTDAAATRRVVQQVLQECGRIDVVVNNAGALLKAWTTECPAAEARQLMEVNFFAQWEMNNAVAPAMLQQGTGVIVNIGSATSYCAVAQAAAYSASKFAVRAYSDSLRIEMAPFGVKVMHVAPGFMNTRLFHKPCSVKPQQGSLFNQLQFATQALYHNDAEQGWGSLFPTDPQHIADKVAKLALSRRSPRHYVAGWLSGVLYCLGCYMPCWVVDLVQGFRLRLPPYFGSMSS